MPPSRSLRRTVLAAVAYGAAAIAVAAAGLHLAWAAGRGRPEAATTALPTAADGRAVLDPSTAATVAVAVALSTYAGAIVTLSAAPASRVARLVVAGGTATLAARVVGDGRYVGLTKRVRSTPFARRDDRLFTPIVAALALGGASALARAADAANTGRRPDDGRGDHRVSR